MSAKEISAKEMFEDLGYKLEDNNEFEIRYFNKRFISDTNYILFDKINKVVHNFIVSDSPFTSARDLPLNMNLLKAINKQVEELGWNK